MQAWLKKQSPCSDGYAWYLNRREEKKSVELSVIIKDLLKEDHFDWANWLIVRRMDHRKKVRYAIFAAEQVIAIYEKKYPGDQRPRKAIEAARAYLKAKGKKQKDAADAAANAAAHAAYAADAAANAVYAAYAAANAAHAAHAAAHAAANAAAYAAAYAAHAAHAAELKEKIIKFGLEIIWKVRLRESTIIKVKK